MNGVLSPDVDSLRVDVDGEAVTLLQVFEKTGVLQGDGDLAGHVLEELELVGGVGLAHAILEAEFAGVLANLGQEVLGIDQPNDAVDALLVDGDARVPAGARSATGSTRAGSRQTPLAVGERSEGLRPTI